MIQLIFSSMLLQSQSNLLEPGSTAPKLAIKSWVKGTPVSSFDKGKTYVVEFWATWCGPCIEGIPHLTELAKKYGSVKFIGVSTWEDNDKHQVQDFVAKMGDKMGYSVAYSGNKDGMAASWLAPAKQNGIPTSFIVKDNIIQWIGHPANLEKPLLQIEKNEFDIQATRKKFETQIAAQEIDSKLRSDIETCDKLYDAGKVTEAKSKLNELEQTTAGKSAAEEIRFRWQAIEDPELWRTKALEKMNSGQDGRNQLCFFINANATRVPAQCKWLLGELTSDRFKPDWYPWLNGGRMHLQLKEYDAGIECCQKARQIILDFQKANPDAPKGNALDVIKTLEDLIKKEKGG